MRSSWRHRSAKLFRSATAFTITVLSAADLDKGGGAGLLDLAAMAPNVAFSSNIGATQIFIRGIGNPVIVPGADPGVAFYGDGAYVSDQFATAPSIFDNPRIELLRTPQGALYSRNATSGAVLKSRSPVF
jgi:iron complex outermembrane receptor protein